MTRYTLAISVLAFGCSRAADGVGAGANHTATSPPGDPASSASTLDHSDQAPRDEGEARSAPALRDADIRWDQNPVMRRLGKMGATMTDTKYSYGFRVDERKGVYQFDCSGMTYWVLKKAAPRAAAALAWKLDHRPLARDIYRRIASIPADRNRHGWLRIARVDALEPGDVVAWIKPKVIRSPNTGHVGFVVLPPLAVPGYVNAHLVRIADSSRLLHDEDTRVGRDGFGMGTILLVSDPDTGAPIAYGWVGLNWRSFETDIALGRALE